MPDNPCTADLETFTECGNDNVENLAGQFQGVVADSVECLEEWSSFRQFLHPLETKGSRIKTLLCDSSWAVIYPNVSTLGKDLSNGSYSSSRCRKNISQLKLIKTRVRN